MTSRRHLLVLTLLALNLPIHAELYKWTDADGNTHFSDKKPADAKTNAVRIEAPKTTDGKNKHSSSEDPVGKVMQQAEHLDQQKEKREEDERLKANRQRWCNDARDNLQYYMNRRPFTYDQGTGEKIFTNDPEFDRRLLAAQNRVQDDCR